MLKFETEGVPNIPSIRPLETLHNELSLSKLDDFLQRVTSSNSTGPSRQTSSAQMMWRMSMDSSFDQTACRFQQEIQGKNQLSSGNPMASRASPTSSSVGWSGPPSFISSGPSSPVWSQLDLTAGNNHSKNNILSPGEVATSLSGPPSPTLRP